MKIVIANGMHAADYVIGIYKHHKKHQIILINDNKDSAKYLSDKNNIPVVYGHPNKKEVLEQARIRDCDIFMALGYKDADNFAACLLAKKAFGARKTICTVSNPKNVSLFRDLGIDSVISSTALLADSLIAESSLEDFIKQVSIEDNSIVMVEIVVKDTYYIARRKIMDIDFPKTGTISCIYRKPHAIIPNGQTVILPKDKLVIVTTPEEQDAIIKFVQTAE